MASHEAKSARTRVQEVLAATPNELKDMERKEVKVNDQLSFLLTRLGGKYYATSGKCTHYGAPLIGAPLSSDGRLMCKWHGACFNVKTGDVEDAPALDSLRKYEVVVKEGGVYVLVDEESLKSTRCHPPCAKYEPNECKETVVIIGGGASGAAAAQKLREENFKGRIRIVSREAYYPVDRIKISKQYGLETADQITLRPKKFWDDLDIEFDLATDADSIDIHNRKVKLSNGQEWHYDHLILASGGWPKLPGLPGEHLKNIFTIRMVDNNKKLSQGLNALKEQLNGQLPSVAIVGSSFIGMELGAAITEKKAGKVTIISKSKVPFQRVLGERIGEALMRRHQSKGVQFVTEAKVKGFEPKKDDPSSVGSVLIEGREPVEADYVIVAVGVRPQTDYLVNNKDLAKADDGSLIVDKYFRVIGTDNVYAIGDVATFPYQHTGEQLRIEHWGYAENTGRTVAMTIAKKEPKAFVHVPYFWTVQFGASLRYAGYAKTFDDVIVQGNTTNVDNYSFVGYFVKGDEVLAICSYMKDPIVSYCAELLRIGKMPKASEVRAGADPLQIPLIVPERQQKHKLD